MRNSMTFACVAALCLGLGGCYESTDVTLYEPGEYKGKSDPLLTKLKSSELQTSLERRFDGQRDR
ncbi:MAG: hypothetical protein RQ741_02640 [Wenzhouxiangellaceae bacterium]|nr:hypothetical protein [Wenzhouxiangellaceae bacterium]